MDALDFIYNGQALSDYGFIIASFGDDGTVTPGGITYTTTNVPNNDRKYISSMQYDSTIVFEFAIAKFDCMKKAEPIDRYEESAIRKWLECEDGYHDLYFRQEDFENIYYRAYFTVTPQIIAGRTYGYKLVATTDNVYAYDVECENEFDMEADIEYSLITFSDKCGYIYPKIEITPFESGDLKLDITANDEIQSSSVFRNVVANQTFKLDCQLKKVENMDFNNFNLIFPRLLQGHDDTFNTITASIPCHIKISYVPRKKICF